MKPILLRDWVTPVTIGVLGLLAVTGVQMFFHVENGLNKGVHEYLSWVLIGAVALHAFVNLPGLKRHLQAANARRLLAVFATLIAFSFLPWNDDTDGAPSFEQPVRALAGAPVPVLAEVAHTSPDAMRRRLMAAGLDVRSDDDTVARLAGDDLHRQMEVLSRVLPVLPAQSQAQSPKSSGNPT